MNEVKKTPKGSYSGPVVIDPLTRIEGHLRIETVVKNGVVTQARSVATLFRGLELILKGRDPRDAQQFTQRTCGVCTYTHALASTRALEDAIGVSIPKNATLIRNLVLGMQYLHDHIVHFYHLHALDFVDVTAALKADPVAAARLSERLYPQPNTADELKAVQERLSAFVSSGQLGPFANAYFLGGHPAYYLDPETNLLATAHYLQALRIQMKAAQAMAVFGGKNPHPQFLVAGGVTCYEALTPERLKEFESLYREVRLFVEQVYIPDLLCIAGAYKDWKNIGGTTNFMTFGEFPNPGGERDLNNRWLKHGVFKNRDIQTLAPFDPSQIAEHVRHSWYAGEEARHPYKGETAPKFTSTNDTERYSWMKAPRYAGLSVETGPLAQVLTSVAQGDAIIKPLAGMVMEKLGLQLPDLFSTLGRTAARGIESAAIAQRMDGWLVALKENVGAGDTKLVEKCEVPQSGEGVGFVTAPRGGLSHWLVIEGGKIKNFQLVVPSTWNLGPRCAKNLPGAVEEALVGTPVVDPARPVEILRTVHSFDPCMACGVHVIDARTGEGRDFRIL